MSAAFIITIYCGPCVCVVAFVIAFVVYVEAETGSDKALSGTTLVPTIPLLLLHVATANASVANFKPVVA